MNRLAQSSRGVSRACFPFSWVNDSMTVKIGSDPGENDLVNKTLVKR